MKKEKEEEETREEVKGKEERRGDSEGAVRPRPKLQVAWKDSEETSSDSCVMEKQGVMDV